MTGNRPAQARIEALRMSRLPDHQGGVALRVFFRAGRDLRMGGGKLRASPFPIHPASPDRVVGDSIRPIHSNTSISIYFTFVDSPPSIYHTKLFSTTSSPPYYASGGWELTRTIITVMILPQVHLRKPCY